MATASAWVYKVVSHQHDGCNHYGFQDMASAEKHYEGLGLGYAKFITQNNKTILKEYGGKKWLDICKGEL